MIKKKTVFVIACDDCGDPADHAFGTKKEARAEEIKILSKWGLDKYLCPKCIRKDPELVKKVKERARDLFLKKQQMIITPGQKPILVPRGMEFKKFKVE